MRRAAGVIAVMAAALLGIEPGVAGEAAATDDAAGSDVCVGVGIGGSPPDPFACLNARLRRSVIAARNQAEEAADLAGSAANAPAPALNLFNESATHERLGDTFGHSPFPQRPERTYDNPLTAGR